MVGLIYRTPLLCSLRTERGVNKFSTFINSILGRQPQSDGQVRTETIPMAPLIHLTSEKPPSGNTGLGGSFAMTMVHFGLLFSGLSNCFFTFPCPPQLVENKELAWNIMFCLHSQLTGDTCLWNKQRSSAFKAVNPGGHPPAAEIGNSVSTAQS